MAAGYETNVTTQLGRHRPGDDALQIKRLPVNQDDDLPLFAAKLVGAYDWLGRFQSLSKMLRRRRKMPRQFPMLENRNVQSDSIATGGRAAASVRGGVAAPPPN